MTSVWLRVMMYTRLVEIVPSAA